MAESFVSDHGANVTFRKVADGELNKGGYGGIYGVGMVEKCPPRLMIMTYAPSWVAHGFCRMSLEGIGPIFSLRQVVGR